MDTVWPTVDHNYIHRCTGIGLDEILPYSEADETLTYWDDEDQTENINDEDEDDILPVSRVFFSLYCKICAKITIWNKSCRRNTPRNSFHYFFNLCRMCYQLFEIKCK